MALIVQSVKRQRIATYRQIQEYVKKQHHCTVKTCWIAHVKELNRLEVRSASNRISKQLRRHSCPDDKRAMIEKALKHFDAL